MTEEQKFELERIRNQFAACIYKPEFMIKECREERIIMKDGAALRTILYIPDREGPVPAILVRTCYPANDYIYRATAEEYCRRGFAYIYQYCRGTGGSDGTWEPNINERADGKVTVDWLCSLSWIGNVGYFGCSYLALTGWVIADILPEKVKTMYLTHYGAFRFTSAYKGGMFRHDVLTAWSMNNAGRPVTADYLKSCRYRPHLEVDEAMWGGRLEWYRKWITSTSRSDEYWNSGFWGMLKEIPEKVNIPIYMGEGWFDHHLASAIESYQALSKECRAKSRFLIGAWDHKFIVRLQDRKGEHFESEDILRAFCWFHDLLVEEKRPKGSVDSYLIGADTWISQEEFTVQSQEELKLYISGSDGEEKCRLSLQKGKKEGTINFVYDPENPVMTHGAESLLVTREEQGSLLQPVPGYRSDVVSIISEPFLEKVPIMGKIKMELEVSSDAEDTAFVVKVMEVMEDGKAYNMRTGITTLGYRDGDSKRQEYHPGERVRISIPMWDIAWEIQKGSRIRIDITSSDFPQYSIHSNYPGGWAEQTKTKKACQTIYFGGEEGSYIMLPVLPSPDCSGVSSR